MTFNTFFINIKQTILTSKVTFDLLIYHNNNSLIFDMFLVNADMCNMITINLIDN